MAGSWHWPGKHQHGGHRSRHTSQWQGASTGRARTSTDPSQCAVVGHHHAGGLADDGAHVRVILPTILVCGHHELDPGVALHGGIVFERPGGRRVHSPPPDHHPCCRDAVDGRPHAAVGVARHSFGPRKKHTITEAYVEGAGRPAGAPDHLCEHGLGSSGAHRSATVQRRNEGLQRKGLSGSGMGCGLTGDRLCSQERLTRTNQQRTLVRVQLTAPVIR